VGVVISDKMEKTRTIAVQRSVRHPFYKKIIRRTSTFHAHDEKNISQAKATP
jgi:small subunit ribosomal protein S17